jgi:hypothetical protein
MRPVSSEFIQQVGTLDQVLHNADDAGVFIGEVLIGALRVVFNGLHAFSAKGGA